MIRHLSFEKDIFNPDLSSIEGGYFYVMPMSQNKKCGMQQEEDFFDEMFLKLAGKQANAEIEEIYFASAYFNPPYKFFDGLLRMKAKSYKFVTAANEANSFFGASFPKGDVPYFYERQYFALMKRALKTSSTFDDSKKWLCQFYRYYKPGWTFHTKRKSTLLTP